MELHQYVRQVQAHLAAAAALGDDRTRQTAEALATATESAMRLAVLAALSAGAEEITAALLDSPGSPSVSVRLDGDEVRIDVRATNPEPEVAPANDDADTSARVSLRLSEALKSEIESAARTEAISVNTWLVRAATRAIAPARGSRSGGEGMGGWDGRRQGGNSSHRITGWING